MFCYLKSQWSGDFEILIYIWLSWSIWSLIVRSFIHSFEKPKRIQKKTTKKRVNNQGTQRNNNNNQKTTTKFNFYSFRIIYSLCVSVFFIRRPNKNETNNKKESLDPPNHETHHRIKKEKKNSGREKQNNRKWLIPHTHTDTETILEQFRLFFFSP